ncbi:MAG: acyl-CoA dehydratase activase [Peptococcaceae bacterium]|jgi:predicted CoA-substrate-specific enzyme activase|nr:acyl-CoA dehydratase activase [Peptococcaceae bacterium]
MITAGIDVGMENVKVVIMDNEKILGRGAGRSGGMKRASSAEAALYEALKEAGLKKDDVEKVYATGKGKFDLQFADETITEAIAAARASQFLCPDATTAVDAGADETIVVTLGTKKPVNEFAQNEKCAAGVGIFLNVMARRFGFTQEEMGALSPKGKDGAKVNDGCVVFAELDALSLLNNGTPIKEVASAVTDAAAIRVCMTMNDITHPKLDKVALFGGLTKNAAFVNALKSYAKVDFVIPADAEYAGAVGAALVAAGWGGNPYYGEKQ